MKITARTKIKIHPLRKIRLGNVLTQKEFAERLKVSQGTISKIEAGLLNPDLVLLSNLKSKFKIDLDIFVLNMKRDKFIKHV